MKKTLMVFGLFCFMLAGSTLSFAKDKKNKHEESGGSKIIDMSKCTCEDMLTEKDDQLVKAALVWIDGYVSGKSGDTRISLDELKGLARQLESYCKANPATPILDAAKKSRARY
jgi:acid stress chaperone HdeB